MLKVIPILTVLALLLVMSTLFVLSPVATAQGPITLNTPAAAPPLSASTTNVDDPARAIAVGNAPQTIQPDSVQWFKFDYTTQTDTLPRPTVTVELLNGVANGLQFEVYAPEQIQNVWYDNPPTGRGTQEVVVDCTNPPANSTQCTTNNLLWIGGLGEDGTVYVRVINNTGSPQTPQLIVAGGGLAACQNPSQPAAQSQATMSQPFTQLQCAPAPVLPAAQ